MTLLAVAGCGDVGTEGSSDTPSFGSGMASTSGDEPVATTDDATPTPGETSDGATTFDPSDESDDGSETTGPGSDETGSTGGPMVDWEFEEVDGLVSVEAEHYYVELNNEFTQAYWYTFRDGVDDPEVTCVTDTPCTNDNRPECNQYPTCDGDDIDPAEAAGGAYVEPLPDRRRTDHEQNTGNLGVVNNQSQAPRLEYRVNFTQTGRYYVWARARGQGPAANGIHVGLDGEWPENDLIDPSSMRMQFPGGWGWTQNRRGGSQHTGVSAANGVSRRDANIWLQIDTPGVHTIAFGMREDGLEFDKFIMVLDPEFEPEGDGPPETTVN
ncbi:MAG: hypothetical protein AAF799_29150 [Myxococcota bacterium]